MPGFDHDPIFLPVVIGLLGILIGFTKGGFNTLFALFTRVLSLVLPVSTAVGVLLLMLIASDAFALYMCWRESDTTLVRRMRPAGIGGALIGSYLLAALSPNALRVALAIFVLWGVACKFASDQIKQLAYQPRRWHALARGALSGVA